MAIESSEMSVGQCEDQKLFNQHGVLDYNGATVNDGKLQFSVLNRFF
jgi:hypothetical protein